MELRAGDGLTLRWSEDGTGRLAWGSPDWLGPIAFAVRARGRDAAPLSNLPGEASLRAVDRAPEGQDALGSFVAARLAAPECALALRASVRAYRERPLLVFRLEALEALDFGPEGSFAEPRVAWPWLRPDLRVRGGLPEGTRAYGHQFTEFAFPTWSDASLARFFLLRHRPPVVSPLWLVAPDRCLLLAPLDAFHEQVIAVPPNPEQFERGVACGWQGDLEHVEPGFATELAIWAGRSPRAVLEAWTRELRTRHGTPERSRYADEGLARLSYWTDNGAAYWYRTEPGCDMGETLERAVGALREQSIPARCVQLDSWFYPHQVTRPFSQQGGGQVPPTGMLRWEPREDVLPGGIEPLLRRLGDPPLILHSRHFSAESPYFQVHAAWRDGDRAHPIGPELGDALLEQAARWGAVTYEQDWMVESFLGVRGLRAGAGRARAWQRGLDRAAASHGLTLQWSMSTPADFLQTLELERVSSIRTSGDYRYLVGSGMLWMWFLHTNALARALGLRPFKDVFFSNRSVDDPDGDPCAEAEALLAALSTGPVGIGDRAGRADPELVLRTCRPDGVLVKPDVPIAALDRCFRANAFAEAAPLIGETWSEHPAGRWHYLACFNAYNKKQPLRFEVAPRELGVASTVLVYDWRSGRSQPLEPDAALRLVLDPLGWAFHLLCPILPGEVALIGDATRYATVGDRRIRGIRLQDERLVFDVLGSPGEAVRVEGWAARRPRGARAWKPTRVLDLECEYAAATGRYALTPVVGAAGWTRIELEPA